MIKNNSPLIDQILVLVLLLTVYQPTVYAQSAQSTQSTQCNAQTLRHTIDADKLWADLTFLASDELQGRRTGSSGSLKAQVYLQQAFKQIGTNAFKPNHRHPFSRTARSKPAYGTNIIGWLLGSDLPEQYIVVTAHFDHMGKEGLKIFNGADDNASGVAALLALARVIKTKPLRHSVIFVATDGEEQGLYGAKAFLRQPPVLIEQIKYNINLDMIGYPGKKRRLYLAGSKDFEQLRPVVNQSVRQASLCLVAGHDSTGFSYDRSYRINWRKASDHYSFYQQGIPYLFFSVGDHKYYHTESDTVDRIDRGFYTAAVESVLTTLQLLDEL